MVLFQGDRVVNVGSSSFLKKTQPGLENAVGQINDNNESASNVICRNEGADLHLPSEEVSTSAPVDTWPNTSEGLYPASHNYEHPAGYFSLFDTFSEYGRLNFTQHEDGYRENNPLSYGLLDLSNFEDFDAIFSSTVGELSPGISGSEDAFGRGLECSRFDFRSLNGTSAQIGLQDNLLPEDNIMTAVGCNSASPPSLRPFTYNMAKSIMQKQVRLAFIYIYRYMLLFEGLRRELQASYGRVGSEIKISTTQLSNENHSTGHGHVGMISRHRRLENQLLSKVKGKDQVPECASGSTSCESEQIRWNANHKHELYNSSVRPHYSQLLDPDLFWLPDASSNMQSFSLEEQMEGILPSQGDLYMQATTRTIHETDKSSSLAFRDPVHFSTHGTQCLEKFPALYKKPPDVILQEMTEKPCLGQHLHTAVTMKEQPVVSMSRTAVLKQNPKSPELTRGDSKLEDLSFKVTAISGESSASQNFWMASSSSDMLVKDVCFQQLQEVTDQLDVRSKLCIRDSLFRLAKSAEQRHIFASTNNQIRECKREVPDLEYLKRCTEHTSPRTWTDPIDCSVTHLLFDRPSESVAAKAIYVMSPKSYIAN